MSSLHSVPSVRKLPAYGNSHPGVLTIPHFSFGSSANAMVGIFLFSQAVLGDVMGQLQTCGLLSGTSLVGVGHTQTRLTVPDRGGE